MKTAWNRLKAGWYRRGLEYSTLPEKALDVILPKTTQCSTFLDAGSGCGTLALPLARAGKSVTALDPSRAMIEILRDDINKEGLQKIRPVLSAWGEREIKKHDVVICANVPELLKDPAFLRGADSLARKFVFLIASAGPGADKFYYRDLYPLIFNRPFGTRTDYLKTYTDLHSLGIYANVEMIEYDFDQPFDSLEDAVEFWKEYMGIVTEEHDRRLGEYLSKRLVKRKGTLLAKFHKRSAIIWWKKDR